MASVINTNMASLYAQKNLSGAQSALSTSVERLSSGLRINRAKDDAAGLGISEKIASQVVSLNQGIRNANDAISMVQTAEGSLSEVSSILQRMKELSVQARNDSLSTTQRSFISDELVALKKEINAIAERTTFNDLSLLKNALRTDVVASSASNRLVNGAKLLDQVTVSGLTVDNANAGSYSFTTGTVSDITGQMSRASSAAIGTVGTDTTQSATGASAAATTVTINLSGVFEVGDTITYTISGVGGTTSTAQTYTVIAENLTRDNDGLSPTVAGNSSQAYTNILTSMKTQFDAANSVALSGTAISATALVFSAAASVSITTGQIAANRLPGERTVIVNSSDVAEGYKLTLSINGKEYSAVAGSEDTAATMAAELKSKVLADYPDASASTVNSNTLTFKTGSGLTVADMSLRVNRLIDGAAVSNKASAVSVKNASSAATARTIIVNDFDIVEGRRATVSVGNPEETTTYSVIIDADDTAATVAGKLNTLMQANFGSVGVNGVSIGTSNTLTFGTGLNLGLSNISISFNETTQSENLTSFSSVSVLTRSDTARTITINQADLVAGRVVSVGIKGKEYAVTVGSGDTDDQVAYKLAQLIDDDYPNTTTATATTQFPVATRTTVTSNIITLTSSAKLGLEDIGVKVRSITNPGTLRLTAGANTGIGGTSQSLNIGSIAAGASKTFDFDNLGVSFTLTNSGAAAVNSSSFAAYTPKANTLEVAATMNGEALFQVGAGTRDTVVLDGFKDIRITGHNRNSGAEKTVFDNINTTLNTIAQNTTESLAEANFATLENQIEDAITMVVDFRGYFGAQQNRIEFAIANIQAQSENLTAANSRIRDTDYAAETANLTKTQIMQQAATAMLAQANQMPNVILALLK